ncbi:MAG: response regulator transcription factor [Actinomycetota bacterium]
MHHVLLVDDELVLRTSLCFTLQQHGFRVTTAPDGNTALRLLGVDCPDLMVLDLMLPGIDGLEVCRRLRRVSDLPVIMLTARGQEEDKIQGLKLGADDYVTKPFSSRELIARIESVLRRHVAAPRRPRLNPEPTAETEVLEYGPFRLRLRAREAQISGTTINLSPKEFQLLWVLMAHQGRALSREELIASVWGDEFMGDAKTLDVHIRWLRAKVEADPSNPEYLLTVRRYGFRFG